MIGIDSGTIGKISNLFLPNGRSISRNCISFACERKNYLLLMLQSTWPFSFTILARVRLFCHTSGSLYCSSGIVARLALSEPCDVVEATHEDFFVNFRRPLIFEIYILFNVLVIIFCIIYDISAVKNILTFEYFLWSLYSMYSSG